MVQRLKNHLGYYLSLLAILTLGLVLTSLFQDKQSQILIMTFTVFSYVGWGVIHHKINHELTPKIVVEYVLIGSLGLTLIFFLLKGGFF